MACSIMDTFESGINPVSNTSKPSLSGTLTRFNLSNRGFSTGLKTTSVISNLQAFEPISIAANLNVFYSLFLKDNDRYPAVL